MAEVINITNRNYTYNIYNNNYYYSKLLFSNLTINGNAVSFPMPFHHLLFSNTLAWRPHLKKDIELLKKVQRRALRMIEEFKGMHYVDILRKV